MDLLSFDSAADLHLLPFLTPRMLSAEGQEEPNVPQPPPYSTLDSSRLTDLPPDFDPNLQPIGIPTGKSEVHVVWNGQTRGLFWNW